MKALAITAALAAVASAQSPKHVIFFLVDDLGFSDLGYKGQMYNTTVLPTPTLDALAMDGVRLEQYYVTQLCSPSRTSLLSGRYPYTIGTGSEVITDGNPDCLPTNIRTVADLLQEQGFATSSFGKQDFGMTTWGCTPNCRGFDYFSGFYNAFNDYFTHRVGAGLDLRVNFEPDFDNGNETGIYETQLITSRVQQWITDTRSARPDAPTFAYVAHQAVHAPQQVPQSHIDGECAALIPESMPVRRILCGMIKAVDESLANISATYQQLGIWNDTLLIVSTDNGGNTDTGGSNWPLRSIKASSFEGGVRGAGFVYGAGLSPSVRGTISTGMISIADWLPTLVEGVAGGSLANATVPKYAYQQAPPPLDGVNVWQHISTGAASPREELLVGLIPDTCWGPVCTIPGQGAYRWHNWKLIVGHVAVWSYTLGPGGSAGSCMAHDGAPRALFPPVNLTANMTPPWCPTGWVPPPESGMLPIPPSDAGCTELPCFLSNSSDYLAGGVWLFDLDADPYEQHNVAAAHPDIVAQLQAKLQAWNASNIPQSHGAVDPASDPTHFGDVWTPWRGNPNPSVCDPNTTSPGDALKSHFDGANFTSSSGGGAQVTLAGWAWSSLAADGGRAPLTVTISLDSTPLASLVANVSRPGLVPKTGAPNPEHGFVYALSPADAARASAGQHRFDVSVLDPGSGASVPLINSPVCYKSGTPDAC